jgi:hypothetical protein
MGDAVSYSFASTREGNPKPPDDEELELLDELLDDDIPYAIQGASAKNGTLGNCDRII